MTSSSIGKILSYLIPIKHVRSIALKVSKHKGKQESNDDSDEENLSLLSRKFSKFLKNVLASQNCVFGKVGLGFNPQNQQDKFSKTFSRKPVKQPIVKAKQPVVTCFYCMKKGHLVRFCKIRKFFVPRGFMKWIPKGCEVPNEKKKSIGPTFVKGPNLVA